MSNLIVVLASTALFPLTRSVAAFLSNRESLVLLAIGPGSLAQSAKAIRMARASLAFFGLDFVSTTELSDRDGDGNQRTALWLHAAPSAKRAHPTAGQNGV